MRNVWGLLLAGMALSSCGKITLKTASGTTISVDTSFSQTASADVASCPSGMTLMPAGLGHGAFCIDNASFGSTTYQYHGTAVTTCATAGKEVCSITELHVACQAGNIVRNQRYWTRNTSAVNTGGGSAIAYDATTCSSWGSTTLSASPVDDYYCCTR